MGENGAFCQILHRKFHENPEYRFPLGEFGNYRRVIRILVMPSSKDIPSELENALKSRNYELISEEDRDVQKLISYSHNI